MFFSNHFKVKTLAALLIVAGSVGAAANAAVIDAEADMVGPDVRTAWNVDPRRSLIVTEQPILARFSLQRVMDQLVRQARVPGLTAKQLFNQWWDTQNPKPGLGLGPHCDSQTDAFGKPVMNGFPYVCRPASDRQEGIEAFNDPFVDTGDNPEFYFAIGLTNRFELAPADGANCGEYRIIFARRSGLLQARNRNLFIFEAALPNPHPEKGLEGCRRIAQFWGNLSKVNDIEKRANRLERFYFKGVGDVPAVISIKNYGANPDHQGRIRTNQFLEQKKFEAGDGSRVWNLRQYHLDWQCPYGNRWACTSLTVVPMPVEDNPYGGLFSPTSTDARAPEFQRFFLTQIPTLASSTLADISMDVPEKFYAADSLSLNPIVDYYLGQLGSGPSAFRSAIQAKLMEIGSTLTVDNIVNRAMATSCAGCHKLNDGMDIGGGLVWPNSARTREAFTPDGFIHITERFTDEVDGVLRYVISPALENEFLPARKRVLDDFLNERLYCKDPHAPIGGRRVH